MNHITLFRKEVRLPPMLTKAGQQSLRDLILSETEQATDWHSAAIALDRAGAELVWEPQKNEYRIRFILNTYFEKQWRKIWAKDRGGYVPKPSTKMTSTVIHGETVIFSDNPCTYNLIHSLIKDEVNWHGSAIALERLGIQLIWEPQRNQWRLQAPQSINRRVTE